MIELPETRTMGPSEGKDHVIL